VAVSPSHYSVSWNSESLHAILGNNYNPDPHYVSDLQRYSAGAQFNPRKSSVKHHDLGRSKESCSERWGWTDKSVRVAYCSGFTNTESQRDTLFVSTTMQSSRGYPLVRPHHNPWRKLQVDPSSYQRLEFGQHGALVAAYLNLNHG